VSVIRIDKAEDGPGNATIRYTGNAGGDSFEIQQGWTRVDPAVASANGGSVLTLHGAAFTLSTNFVCIFERAASQTLVTRGTRVSALTLLCPTPQWGHWNAAGRAAGEVWLDVSNDARFATVDRDSDLLISYAEFRLASRLLAHDNLDVAQLAILFDRIDVNGDAGVSLGEFWVWAPRMERLAHVTAVGVNVSHSIVFETMLDHASRNHVPTSVLPSGGQVVYVRGAGFDPSIKYTCIYSDASLITHKASSTASFVNVTIITCPTVYWIWPKTANGVLGIFVNLSALAVENQTHASLPLVAILKESALLEICCRI
jgi:hypothetical protein